MSIFIMIGGPPRVRVVLRLFYGCSYRFHLSGYNRVRFITQYAVGGATPTRLTPTQGDTVVLRLFFGDRDSGRNMVPNSLS